MRTEIPSYSEIFPIGNKYVDGYLDNVVTVEEKVDGSQFSILKENGKLLFRSHGKQVYPENAGMFDTVVKNMKDVDFHDGWVYRGEYLRIPHHNCLTYNRVPVKNWVIFDIDKGNQDYMVWEDKKAEADRIGLECVPKIYRGIVTQEMFNDFLLHQSFLGGSLIEGVVLKNYDIFAKDKKVLMAKYVSEKFKEEQKVSWKQKNPHGKDVVQNIITEYKTEARWRKAVQHLSENGELEHDPSDIGKLMKELSKDVVKDGEKEIVEQLKNWAIPQIQRGVSAGFAEWYKKLLVNDCFENNHKDVKDGNN